MNYELFMEMALEQAESALSTGEFPVGCVIVHGEDLLVTGSRTGTAGDAVNEIDHAEMVALRRLADLDKTIDKNKTTLFCTLEPCLMCFAAILLSGIGKIVYAYEDVMGGGTNCDLTRLAPLYEKCRIPVVPNILREKSLSLFKAYFEDPDNIYWKESLLARYTLNL